MGPSVIYDVALDGASIISQRSVMRARLAQEQELRRSSQPASTSGHERKAPGSGKPWRVAFLTRALRYGGTEKHLIELTPSLDLSRVEPIILCFGTDPYSDRLNRGGYRDVEVRSRLSSTSFFDWLRMFREVKPEVAVFVHNDFSSFTWHAYLAARTVSRRVYSIHQLIAPVLPPKIKGISLRSVVRRVAGWRARAVLASRLMGSLGHRTICVSNAVRQRLIDDYCYPRDKVLTIHNGVRLSEFHPSEGCLNRVRQDLGLCPDDTVLVCVARLNPQKGIDILLQAIATLTREHHPCKCIIVGDGPLRNELTAQVCDLGLSSNVFLVGFREDVRSYLQAADIFVLTSHAEGLPLALLEAMACGLPSVVTNVAGNAEAVTHNVNGLVVRPGSVADVANAIAYLTTHRAERSRMSRRARAKVEQLFSMDDCLERLQSVILG